MKQFAACLKTEKILTVKVFSNMKKKTESEILQSFEKEVPIQTVFSVEVSIRVEIGFEYITINYWSLFE